MFGPLLEHGDARDECVTLRGPDGCFRQFALRIGMFMSDIPEINRQLGMSLKFSDIKTSARYDTDM